MENKTPQPPRKCPLCDGVKFTAGKIQTTKVASGIWFLSEAELNKILRKPKLLTAYECENCHYVVIMAS
jgi:rubrerythrin